MENANENKNYFNSYEDWYGSSDYYEYKEHLTESALDIMADAWILGINCAWVKARFNNNEQDEVMKHIIRKCRDYEWNADRYCLTEDDRDLLNRIKKRNQRDLYSILVGEIYDYCMNM